MFTERPPWYAVGLADKDCRGVPSARPTRVTGLLVENQEDAPMVMGRLSNVLVFGWYTIAEKKAYRREKECVSA